MSKTETFSSNFAQELVRQQLFLELTDANLGIPFNSISPHDLPAHTDKTHPETPGCHDNETLKIGIVGAGMAGLYTAFIIDELQSLDPPVLNHKIEYEILEASNRAGGRCLTHRFSKEPHDYYDAGAMRFPEDKLMDRFFRFCKATDTPTIPHYHSKGSVNCPLLFNGVRKVKDSSFRWEDDPFQVADQLKIEKKDPSQMLYEALQEYVDALNKDFRTGYEKLMEIDHLSTRDFLFKKFNENKAFKEKADIASLVQYLETFAGTTDLFTQSVSEEVFQLLDFHTRDWRAIEGGLEVLTKNAIGKLKSKPEYEKRVNKLKLQKTDNGKPESMQVFIADEQKPRDYNTVISTTTLGALSRIDMEEVDLNWGLRNAIRGCRYAPATKIAVKFSYPWWRTKCNITSGGVGFTDNLLRWCVYPSYNLKDDSTKPAVLLCSYTWTHDAFRFGSLVNHDSPNGEDEIKELILRELAALHNIELAVLKDAYITHHSYNWYMDKHASGACTSFTPGQFSQLYPLLARPAGKGLLHIAGEATSAHHGWIVGALESAYRSVYYFLSRFNEEAAKKEMAGLFGRLDEIETDEKGTSHLQMVLGCMDEEKQPTVGLHGPVASAV